MKKILFFLFISTSIFSQDFTEIDKKTSLYPKLISAEKLAQNISKDFNSKDQQVKAASYWLTQNIRYDLEAYYNPTNKRISFKYRNEAERLEKIKAIRDNIVKETLQGRKGVCEGYAQTLSKVLTLLNIENEVIKGYIRNTSRDINNPRNGTNHAWNAVKLNGNWIYIDATWAAGAVMNGKWYKKFNPYYYNIPIKKYFNTHYPESKIWQLRVGNMTLTDFYKQPIFDSSFLNSNLELVSPKNGTLTTTNNQIKIKLKNLKNNQDVRVGFIGYQYAIKPEISTKNNITTLTITPPTNSNELFLLIDRKVVLEFLIQ